MNKHIMLDLETMGASANAVICSMAAVDFDIETGSVGRIFNEVIDIQSALDAGLEVDGSTIKWWLRQSEVARIKVSGPGNHINNVLINFTDFIEGLGGKNVRVWGNGCRFDNGLLINAYRKCFLPIPIGYNMDRDVRTMVEIAPDVRKETPFIGTEHDPVDDCIHQIKYLVKAWNLSQVGNLTASLN